MKALIMLFLLGSSISSFAVELSDEEVRCEALFDASLSIDPNRDMEAEQRRSAPVRRRDNEKGPVDTV